MRHPTTLVFAGDSEQRTRLMFQRSAADLTIRADAGEPNRLVFDGQPVTTVIFTFAGPAVEAFWQALLPQGRPVRSVDGVTISYSTSDQVLALLVENGEGTTILVKRQEVLRVEIQLIGPGAAAIWASMSQQFPPMDDPFADFTPERRG